MLQRLLLRWFGLATVDVGRVAAALAEVILDDWGEDVSILDPFGTQQQLRTRYMRLATRYGLPTDLSNEVAGQAWEIIAQLREGGHGETAPGFSFYD